LLESNLIVIALAGVLVGFGTKLANGCTSGHGIIGMGRLSKRSIIATVIFMSTSILVVFLKRMMGWM
ncbi:YeeE/YedE thiosulfate transporter family protein, partial [Vibrio sp. 10N.261.55.A7]|uniref:YeeE/YedE family protein n=1 Tax=Vibrio sp. 10N.261.55.A7 TaxID=1880851 RepID=UPI0012FFED85